ncbi:MAG TPA: hypothetical protein VMV23_06215 [Candidatus Nanopelagicaceae bacterium]|nr:hypothetical protein [Candidatus Nanopelagicaceae bacterium]
MLQLAAYWLLVMLAGLAAVDLIPHRWAGLERLAAALAVGLVGSTAVSFGLSLGMGLGVAAALGGPTALLLVGLGLGWRRWRSRFGIGPNRWWGQLREVGWSVPTRWGVAIAILLGIGLWLVYAHTLQPTPSGTLVASANVWGDWSVHASYVQSFHLGHNLPPLDSLESGTQMRYPFLVDFQPALLEALGQNLYGALDMASLAISWAAGMLVWQLALRVTRRPLAATVALSLVLFGGGLGFVGAYADGCQQLAHTQAGFDAAACTHLSSATPAAVIGFVGHLPTELTHLPRAYDGQGSAPAALPDLQWYEPLLAYWMPQRDFAFGIAMVALLAGLLWEAARRPRRGLLIGAGVLGATLPFFNPFGYMVVGLLGVWWLARRGQLGPLATYLIPLLGLGLPQLWLVISGPHGQLGGPVGTNLFPQIDLGWLSHATVSCTAAQFQSGAVCDGLYLAGASPLTLLGFAAHTLAEPSFYGAWLGFWISNTGLFILLGLAVLGVSLVPGRLGTASRRRGLVGFAAPFWAIFLIANVVVTQPWNWDNTKLLSYWYLGVAIPVAWLLTSAGRNWWSRILAGATLLSLVLTGLLSLDAAFLGQSTLNQAPPTSATVTLDGRQAEQVARAVIAHTPSQAIFLTEGQPNDPVTTLAGRTVVLGYDGWLWSYGQPLSRRLGAVETMYAGCPATGGCQLGRLLRRYRVSYVEFEPGDYNNIPVNLAWYRSQRLPVVVQTSNYVIFAVRSLWSPSG